jgi:hypothetical protein
VYLLYQIGIDPVNSLRAITSLAAAICYLFMVLHFKNSTLALVALPILALVTGVLEVGREENADSIAAMLFAGAVYFIGRKSHFGLAFLVLLPLARSDTILLVLLFLPIVFSMYSRNWFLVLALASISLSSHYAVNHYFENYGWAMQFYVVHVQYLPTPADIQIDLRPSQYFGAIGKGIPKLIFNTPFLVFCLFQLIVGAIYLGSNSHRQNSANKTCTTRKFNWIVSLICVAYVLAHFLTFPSMLTRYFAGQYFFVSIYALTLISTFRTK